MSLLSAQKEKKKPSSSVSLFYFIFSPLLFLAQKEREGPFHGQTKKERPLLGKDQSSVPKHKLVMGEALDSVPSISSDKVPKWMATGCMMLPWRMAARGQRQHWTKG